MKRKLPNPETYRPLLGEDVNRALFRLVESRNIKAVAPLGVNEYLRKMIAHWWRREFPGEAFPVETEPYHEDVDIENVQSA